MITGVEPGIESWTLSFGGFSLREEGSTGRGKERWRERGREYGAEERGKEKSPRKISREGNIQPHRVRSWGT